MFRKLFSAAFIVFASVGFARAQDNIAWKFKSGEQFYIEESSRVNLNMQVDGSTESVDMKSRLVSRFTVQRLLPDGGLVIKQTVVLATATANDGPAIQMEGFEGAEFLMTFDRDMKLRRLEGFEEFLDRLSPEQAANYRGKADDLKARLVEPLNIYVPNKIVRQGDEWAKSRDLGDLPIGVVNMKLTFRHQGFAKVNGANLQKVDFTGAVQHRFPADQLGVPVQFVGGNLRFDGVRGTVLFDSAKGRLHQMNFIVPIKGNVTLKINGLEMPARIDAQVEQTIKVFDEKPVA